MRAQLLANAQMVLPGDRVLFGNLLIADGKIVSLNPAVIPAEASRMDCQNQTLTPGLIDVHTHGIHHHVYHYSQEPASFAAALKAVLQYGTTCVVPTIVPAAQPGLLEPLSRLMEELPAGTGAFVPGFHLEGPFVALGGAACPTLPGDLDLLKDLVHAGGHRIRIMSISPDQKHIVPVIQWLKANGILPFITHTRASVEQTEAAIEAGARHATHFYDVFPVPEEKDAGVRPAGAVEAILADPRVSVDFICDGVHVHPAAIRAALAAKGWQKVLLITDSNIGAGLPPGEHDTPWGYRIKVSPGDAARHATEGYLAGSALTMNAGIRNLVKWLRLPPSQIWAMGTLNPANLLGLTGKGRIAPGADADLVLWDADLNAIKTWVGGKCLFDRADADPDTLAARDIRAT